MRVRCVPNAHRYAVLSRIFNLLSQPTPRLCKGLFLRSALRVIQLRCPDAWRQSHADGGSASLSAASPAPAARPLRATVCVVRVGIRNRANPGTSVSVCPVVSRRNERMGRGGRGSLCACTARWLARLYEDIFITGE